MTAPKTLLELAGADLTPATVDKASLVLIDIQNEYLDGPLKISGGPEAIGEAKKVLEAARKANAPIFHIAHKGREGGPFDREQHRGQIVDELTPLDGEPVIEKSLPNAFAGTSLADEIEKTGRKEIILVGFMTHMCISSTARAGLDLGLRNTIVDSACGTRDLPASDGSAIDAATIHKISLAELKDRFAIIAQKAEEVTS